VRERIRLNSEIISDTLFAQYFWHVHYFINDHVKLQRPDTPSIPGYPGFLTLLAFYVLVQEGYNIAVIETGMGGQNDSTNIIEYPLATDVTTIGLDHTKALGPSIRDIAWHKGGIFKSNVSAYTVEQNEPSVLEVLQQRAHERSAASVSTVVSDKVLEEYGITVTPDLTYQRRNAALAIALCETSLRIIDSRPSLSRSTGLLHGLETSCRYCLFRRTDRV
jgi:folylpolyglutamate synthase